MASQTVYQLAAGGAGQPAWAGTIAIVAVVALPFLQSAAKPALRRVFVSILASDLLSVRFCEQVKCDVYWLAEQSTEMLRGM